MEGKSIIAAHIVGELCRVVIRAWVASRQTRLGMPATHVSHQPFVALLGSHFSGKIIALEHVCLLLESFIHMQIIMTEHTVALIRMHGIGRYDVKMVWT